MTTRKMTTTEKAAQKIMQQRRAERMNAHHAATRAVVAADKCPLCGSKVRANLSLTGWYQCEQYGANSFRARPNDPSCYWEGFTE